MQLNWIFVESTTYKHLFSINNMGFPHSLNNISNDEWILWTSKWISSLLIEASGWILSEVSSFSTHSFTTLFNKIFKYEILSFFNFFSGTKMIFLMINWVFIIMDIYKLVECPQVVWLKTLSTSWLKVSYSPQNRKLLELFKISVGFQHL